MVVVASDRHESAIDDLVGAAVLSEEFAEPPV
jgi:hypothetical protein